MPQDPQPTVVSSGKFLALVRRDGWEYVTRPKASGVVAIVAITSDNKVLLVEQRRIALNASVIELPAGLTGDSQEHARESAETSAKRELFEETGYEAGRLLAVTTGPTSPGLCDEMMTIFVADQLKQIGPPEGDGHEQITLHEIPLASVDAWLAAQEASGKVVDLKVHAGLHLLKRSRGN